MTQWILIFVLHFNQPATPVVIQGFATEKDCQTAAEHLHTPYSEQRLAPSISSSCIPVRIIIK